MSLSRPLTLFADRSMQVVKFPLYFFSREVEKEEGSILGRVAGAVLGEINIAT